MENNQLVRHDGSLSETVVLVGNGAIKNGWKPLRDVLDPMIDEGDAVNEAIKGIRIQNRESFHQLSIISYRFKLYRAQTLRKLIERELTLPELEKEGLDPVVPEFIKLRSDIAQMYRKCGSDLSLRSSHRIQQLIGEGAFFITTNWDETLWNDSEIKNLAYLHGRCSIPESIVFPTELLIDDTIFDPKTLEGFNDCSTRFQDLLSEVFRFKAIGNLMKTIAVASEAIQRAKKVIVWGFNLADYDADVNTLLSTNTHPNQELTVINTDFSAYLRAVGLTNIAHSCHYDPFTKVCLKMEV